MCELVLADGRRLLLHASGVEDAVNERLLGVMEREALDHEPQRVAQLLAEVTLRLRVTAGQA